MFSRISTLLFAMWFILGLTATGWGYSLSPGDTLEIKIVGHDELGSKQTITPDGSISVPLLGRLDVQNKTLPELYASLTTGYGKYIKTPQVSTFLGVKDPKSTENLYFVGLHDLKKDNWEVKSAKSAAEALAWTNGRGYQILRNGQKFSGTETSPTENAMIILPGDSLLASYSKAPDFFEENGYKILTAPSVVTGIYLGLRR
jgi:hypothetical protein